MKRAYQLPILLIMLTAVIGLGFVKMSQPTQPKTLKLIPMMRLLLSDANKMNKGIYTENYSLIHEGAKGIAHHPGMTQSDKTLIQQSLDKDFKQFVKFDMTVHHHADSIAAAAQAQNMDEVLRHYQIVQKGCVDCHSHFRQRIIQAKNNK